MKKLSAILIVLVLCVTVLFIFYRPKFYTQKKKPVQLPTNNSQLLGSKHKDEIIEAALTLSLPPTDSIVPEEAVKISEQSFQKVQEGNYEEALHIVHHGLKKYPTNFILQDDLASLLGDCSEMTPEPLRGQMAQRSKELFNKLIQECGRQPKAEQFRFKNEYYFRFARYREQYELGLERVAAHWGTPEWTKFGYRGYYSQGVGAARYAQQLIKQGNRELARDYAQKSVNAWAQYLSYRNDYYNAYVHYALALGILGHYDEMMKALARSAAIINKGLDYFEFAEVIDFIKQYGDAEHQAS